jgi:integrase
MVRRSAAQNWRGRWSDAGCCDGVTLRRTRTGRWEVRWREGGRRYGRTFDVRADAVAFRFEIRRRQQLGGFVTPELDVTLAEFVGEWWELHVVPNLARHTQVGYARLLTKHLLPDLGGTRLRSLTPRVLNRWRAEKLRHGVGEPTVRKSLAVLQSVLRLAVEEERLDANSVDKIRKPSQLPRRSVDPLPPLMIERLRGELALRDATLVSVLAYVGVRPGEALGLRWRDIGERRLAIERAVAFGEIKSTKTGRMRSVELLGPLGDDLESWRAASHPVSPNGLVFPRADGAPWAADDWANWRNRVFRPAARRVGLSGTRPYDLRASFVSLLIFEGHTVIEVARQAGHSPETCLRNYARVFSDYDPAARIPAEEQIRAARRAVAEAGRRADARDRAGRAGDVAERLEEVARGRWPSPQPSRRPDSNRGPLHYE